MNLFFLNLLPYYFSKRVERFRVFRRIGMSFSEALQSVVGSSTWSSFVEARLNILPDDFSSNIVNIVDVGANRGDWSDIVLCTLKPKRLISIEPNPIVYAELLQRFRSCSAVTVLNLGTGSQAVELPFHITNGSQCASFLKPVSGICDIYGDLFIEEKTISIRVEKLDTILKEIVEISLLKIDVQGYERAVLLGAIETLKKTNYVLIEVNFTQHYENDIQFFELDQIMSSHGFILANLSPPFIKQEKVLWADALYRRA